MEKNGKEPETYKHRSNVFLLVLCVIVVAQFAAVAKNFASLNALNNRLNSLEEEKSLGSKSLKSQKHEPSTSRSKRSTDETKFDKAMFQLRKIEER
jgi:ABC-type uncharacterized transport system fused permease/ATPase subunit